MEEEARTKGQDCARRRRGAGVVDTASQSAQEHKGPHRQEAGRGSRHQLSKTSSLGPTPTERRGPAAGQRGPGQKRDHWATGAGATPAAEGRQVRAQHRLYRRRLREDCTENGCAMIGRGLVCDVGPSCPRVRGASPGQTARTAGQHACTAQRKCPGARQAFRNAMDLTCPAFPVRVSFSILNAPGRFLIACGRCGAAILLRCSDGSIYGAAEESPWHTS